MEVKDAIQLAKNYIRDVFSDESIVDLGLEEVEYDENYHRWRVTLGFSRPWNSAHSQLAMLTGDNRRTRSYKIITISEENDKVISIKSRDSNKE